MSGGLLIPLAAQPEMPWANGGGTTRQVAIDPPTGSLTVGFRWRLSRAQVRGDGPFSRLPGVDRSLWLLRGAGVRLTIDGRDVVLDRPLARVDFVGEASVTARLLDGPIEDLNVMVARGVVATATVHELGAGPLSLPPAAQRLLLVLAGEIALRDGPRAVPGEAVRVDGGGLVERVGAAARLFDFVFEPGAGA